MKILVQWSEEQAKDWQEVDSSEWVSLPKREAPKGEEKLDPGIR